MLFVKVPKKMGEKVRRRLADSGMLSREYQVESDDGFIYLPVSGRQGGYEFVEREGLRQERGPQSIRDALSSILKGEELDGLVTSFDIIGDIAIIEVPQSLGQKEKQIAKAIMEVHRNIRVVAKKAGAMSGEFRVRPLEVIAGEPRTETTYTEHGVRMELDPAKVYFSIRLSNERKRIAELAEDGESILALFAGVGPFPLVIAKKHPKARIVAVELNPEAVHYMERNISINKARNIKVELGDARDVVSGRYEGFADRIIMPLPMSAESFLDVAFKGARDNAMVHFYTFAMAKDPFNEALAKAKAVADKCGVRVELVSSRIARPYSPGVVQVVLDLRVRKLNRGPEGTRS